MKLTKPEVTQSKDTWGAKLNTDMDLVDSWATQDRLANLSGLQTGLEHGQITKFDGTPIGLDHESFRVAGAPLFYADNVDIGPIGNPGVGSYRSGTLVPLRHLYSIIDQLIPLYTLLMWAGNETNVPYGWGMCNGGVHYGIQCPDYRGRLLYAGYNSTDGVAAEHKVGGQSGAAGSFNHTHPITIGYHANTIYETPPHTHATNSPGTQHWYVGRDTTASATYNLSAGTNFGSCSSNAGDGLGQYGNGTGAAAGHTHENSSVQSNTTPGVPWQAISVIMKCRNMAQGYGQPG